MKPIGPGGYELSINWTTPNCVYKLALAPLSWGFGIGRVEKPEIVMLQIGPIKMEVQKPLWVGDAVD